MKRTNRFLFALFLVLLISAARIASAGTLVTNTAPACCCHAAAESKAPQYSEQSIFQLNAAWTNDAGKEVTLGTLRGRPQVVAMFFANCQSACPLLVYQMTQIESALPEGMRAKAGFLLVSFDTKRDTPEALRAYRNQRELSERNWTLLTGSPDGVLELSSLLGVQFKQDAKGQFLHSNVLTLLNSEGEIVYQETGLNSDHHEIVRKLEELTLPQTCRR